MYQQGLVDDGQTVLRVEHEGAEYVLAVDVRYE